MNKQNVSHKQKTETIAKLVCTYVAEVSNACLIMSVLDSKLVRCAVQTAARRRGTVCLCNEFIKYTCNRYPSRCRSTRDAFSLSKLTTTSVSNQQNDPSDLKQQHYGYFSTRFYVNCHFFDEVYRITRKHQLNHKLADTFPLLTANTNIRIYCICN